MIEAPVETARRILLVDDNVAIHEDFRRILTPAPDEAADLDLEAARLFGPAPTRPAAVSAPPFRLHSASRGEQALALVEAAVAAGEPYAVAFVDMRMPGWDGLTTITRLWEVDPEMMVVICTAHTDHSWSEIRATLVAQDRWLVLKKPCDKIEVLQLAHALSEKWLLARRDREHRAGLETLVRQRTAQLEQSTRVKNEFLANVSHELLTPMNGIVGMHDLLADTNLDDEQREFVRDARECSDRLLQLLQEILAYNQAEAGTLALDPVVFDPVRLLEEMADCFRARAEHKGLVLHVRPTPELPRELRAPAPVIRLIIRALLDNAVKFTVRGSVELSMHAVGGRLFCTVRDTGPGLSREQIDWVMQPFAQVDGGTRRRNSGIGLGLALAQRLAVTLGGKLLLSSTPGEGTTLAFSTLLPRRAG